MYFLVCLSSQVPPQRGSRQRETMTAMFRAASWAFRGLRRSSVPLSARMSSNRADRSCALAEKVAVITGSTKG